MQRRLLRDRQIVSDDWAYIGEPEPRRGRILSMDQWLAESSDWAATAESLGVVLQPEQRIELLVPSLSRFALIAAEFTDPSEGRGYSQGRILRERYGFRGELRAVGHVRQDQIFFLARCGFNSFELPEAELAAAADALSTFSAEYQPANDLGLAGRLTHRWPARG